MLWLLDPQPTAASAAVANTDTSVRFCLWILIDTQIKTIGAGDSFPPRSTLAPAAGHRGGAVEPLGELGARHDLMLPIASRGRHLGREFEFELGLVAMA